MTVRWRTRLPPVGVRRKKQFYITKKDIDQKTDPQNVSAEILKENVRQI